MDDTECADFGEIKSFGDHLSAHDNVIVPGINLVIDFMQLTIGIGIGIKADDAGARKEPTKLLFEKFSAESLVMNGGVLAVWACGGDWVIAAADVAAHLVFVGM